jgi:hypothetical protein
MLAIDNKNDRSAAVDKVLSEFGKWTDEEPGKREVTESLIIYLNAVFGDGCFRRKDGGGYYAALARGFRYLGIINLRSP